MGQKLKHPTTVAIVIVTFNDLANLARCVSSLESTLASQRYHYHLTVVDNSTNQASKKQIHHYVNTINNSVYLDPKTNTGFAKGNNLALHHEFKLDTDYCLLLNSDTELYQGELDRLIKQQQQTNAALVGACLVYGEDPKRFWYGGGCWQPYLGIVRHDLRNELKRHQPSAPVTFINGAAMLIPKSTYDKYGGFFEPYFMYYEDSDYSVQLVRQGELLFYVPSVVIKHYVPKTSAKSALAFYYLTRNHWLFWIRHSRGPARLTSWFAISIFQLSRYILNFHVKERRQAIWQAWHDSLTKSYGKTFSAT